MGSGDEEEDADVDVESRATILEALNWFLELRETPKSDVRRFLMSKILANRKF